jgi:hypothetical protein
MLILLKRLTYYFLGYFYNAPHAHHYHLLQNQPQLQLYFNHKY